MTKIRPSDDRAVWVEMLAGAKPCIRPSSTVPDEFSVRFPCGGTATYCKPIGANPVHEWSWDAEPNREAVPVAFRGPESGDRRKLTGWSTDAAWCLRAAWSAVMPAPPAIEGGQLPEPAEVDSLERGKYTALMRAVLKARTGDTFACRGSSGTAYSWLTITAPPARVDGSYMSMRDAAILSGVFAESIHIQGLSLAPTAGYRSWHLYKAAGYPTDGIALREHAWKDN